MIYYYRNLVFYASNICEFRIDIVILQKLEHEWKKKIWESSLK